MPKLPNWLPAIITSHVQTLIDSGGLGDMKEPLIRLTTDQDMFKVWNKLEKLSDTPQQLVDYLEFVRLHPAVMGLHLANSNNVQSDTPDDTPPAYLSVPGDAVQRKAFKKVAYSCEAALHALSSISRNEDTEEGWNLLEYALQRMELSSASKADICLMEARKLLDRFQQYHSLPEVLEAIKEAATLATAAPSTPLPKKRKDIRAGIQHLASNLPKYLKTHFGRPLYEVAAITTNSAFGLYDKAIDADYVRKLKPS